MIKRFFHIRIYSPQLLIIDKLFGKTSFRLLDVGCGPNSAGQFKHFFPGVEYHGIDYHNPGIKDVHIKTMDGFYDLDLNKNEFDKVPDGYFDALVLSHVLEHLNDPLATLKVLLEKLKPGGYIFIEYPSQKSAKIISSEKLPLVKGTLNFYDDKTHVNLVDTTKVVALLEESGLAIIKNKIRRNYFFMLLSPLILSVRFVRNKFVVRASDLWDFVGFAQLVYAHKI
jgi:2-polyprenyl-3-methyl-5-hydroxy-6-metoxy-1,4-benzoquinol methylase